MVIKKAISKYIERLHFNPYGIKFQSLIFVLHFSVDAQKSAINVKLSAVLQVSIKTFLPERVSSHSHQLSSFTFRCILIIRDANERNVFFLISNYRKSFIKAGSLKTLIAKTRSSL